MSFYERYYICCMEAGIAPASKNTAELLGCTNSNITAWKKNNSTPRGDIVARAATMLNVSADYLLGLISSPKPVKESLSDEDLELISAFKELNMEGRMVAKNVIQGLLSLNAYNSSKP